MTEGRKQGQSFLMQAPVPDSELILVPYGFEPGQILQFVGASGEKENGVYVATHRTSGRVLMRTADTWLLLHPNVLEEN